MIEIKLTDEHYGNPLPGKMRKLIQKHTNRDDREEARQNADISIHLLDAVITGSRALTHKNGVAIRQLLQIAYARAKNDIKTIEEL